jgi:ribosomal protein S15P/S13E
MDMQNNITLIKGEFETQEAKDILRDLIDFKIKFHQIKSLNSELKIGEKDSRSQARIKELKASMHKMLEIMREAEENGFSLKIDAKIEIEFQHQETQIDNHVVVSH